MTLAIYPLLFRGLCLLIKEDPYNDKDHDFCAIKEGKGEHTNYSEYTLIQCEISLRKQDESFRFSKRTLGILCLNHPKLYLSLFLSLSIYIYMHLVLVLWIYFCVLEKVPSIHIHSPPAAVDLRKQSMLWAVKYS